MARGKPIQPALVQYFMSRVGQPVKLQDITKALDEDPMRVRNAIGHLVRGSLPEELGKIRVIMRAAVWQLDGPPMPDPAKDYDAWAEATSAAEITELDHARWVESGSTLPFQEWREQQTASWPTVQSKMDQLSRNIATGVTDPPAPWPTVQSEIDGLKKKILDLAPTVKDEAQQAVISEAIAGPNGLTGQWSDEAAPDPRWPSEQENPLLDGLLEPAVAPEDEAHARLRQYMERVGRASATDQALADALATMEQTPTVKDWQDAKMRHAAGDPRSLLAIVTDLVVDRYNRPKSYEEHIRKVVRDAEAHRIGADDPSTWMTPAFGVVKEKPAGAFTTPETMYQRVGTTADNEAILRDEDGNFWKATRI